MLYQVIALGIFAAIIAFIAGYSVCYHSESRKMKHYCSRENCRSFKDKRCVAGHCTEHCGFSTFCNRVCIKMWQEEQTFISKIHNS
jgi:hypothetical protein